MNKVLLYSALLVSGLVASQFLGGFGAPLIQAGTMFCLAFIMIRVGFEFEIDKSRPKQYAWDYLVAGTAAAFPWVLCALYFVFVMAPAESWWTWGKWKEALLQARFASPTSAGVLFSMLAAAGLARTWVFRKARVLAIFDDLDTILLMIPLKMMMVGLRWQLIVSVAVIVALLSLAWRYLHSWQLPVSWPWVMLYAAIIAGVSEAIYLMSTLVDDSVPVHLEVLLPAFVLGCMLAHPKKAAGSDGHEPESVLDRPDEQRVSTLLSAVFMVLVGLSMPAVPRQGTRWGLMAMHVVAVTLISNIGKMFPALCYRREASFRERLALSVAMFPRGEVGAGVLVVSLSYGIAGPSLTVAALSLALNLLLTGVFIAMVKKLIAKPA